MNTVISVENLGKKYVIGHENRESYSALRDVISNKVKHTRNKIRNIFSSNRSLMSPQFSSEDFWALKDVSFEVNKGDRIGIIGRNGAGKSTLLKILSRITEPTAGRVKIKGKVASLLEIGTGFHPELTGRENIFLNGALLGMNRVDIKKKFDEIVDFAEIEKFLDTPVKRYSSGMYVRLAFAVAAHLESEILIVDEVLAVGDAEFQKKCLGKMGEVSKGEGRTVLFVSHNLTAIKNLCINSILLNNGEVSLSGSCTEVIHHYLVNNNYIYQKCFSNHLDKPIKIRRISLLDMNKNIIQRDISTDDNFIIKIEYQVNSNINGVHFTLRINVGEGETILSTSDSDLNPNVLLQERQIGKYAFMIKFPGNILGENIYTITCSVGIPYQTNYDVEFYAINFKIYEKRSSELIHFKRDGYLSVKLPWENL